MKLFQYFLMVFLSFILVSASAQEDPVQQKSSELTQWMIDNFQLTEKQVAAVKEISYDIAKAVVESGSATEMENVLQAQLSKVLSLEEVEMIRQELNVKE